MDTDAARRPQQRGRRADSSDWVDAHTDRNSMAAPSQQQQQQQRGSGIEGKSSASDAPMDVHAFIASTAALVGLERRAEVEEEGAYKSAKSSKELERAGVLLSRLVVTDIATGLYGRCLLTLEPARGGLLPQSEMAVRDIVEISSTQATSAASSGGGSGSGGGGLSGSSKLASGVIYRLKETSLTLVLDDFLDPQARLGQLSVLKLANQVTYDRYKFGLDFLAREFGSGGGLGVSSRLMRVLYGDVLPVTTTRPTSWIPFSRSLNESQHTAVQNALDANDLYMIHGPPGTGKTTTVVELIRQFVSRGLRVLACAPSNLAVDNLVEKLGEKLPMRPLGKQSEQEQRSLQQMMLSNTPASSSAAFSAALANSSSSSAFQSNRGYDLRITRLGHPARIIPSVLKYTLDSVVHASDAEAVCAAMRADMAALNKSIDKSRDRNERNGMRKEVRELQRALRDRERRAISESLLSTEVLCCTLVNAASKLMDPFGAPGGGFDVVVIDEAAQALEVACLLPAMKGRKLILAGDPFQLGPTVKSKEACEGGFERTLFDRLLSKPYGASITTMLVEQYRMHATIMEWSSGEMYNGRLRGPDSITSHLLSGLEGVRATEDTQAAFVVIDTAGLNLWENDPADEVASSSSGAGKSLLQKVQQRSKSNTHEAALLRVHLESLLSSGVKLKDIGVITPYNGQVSLLRELLLESYPALEIGTVDGFQGREKEAILISMVRSNSAREVGFLREDRRMNVAITRARRHVCIILDSDTVSSHPFLARLVDYAAEHGDYRMADDPNEVRQDLSGGAGAEGAVVPGAAGSSVANDGERKEDGVGAAAASAAASSHQSPIVSKPRAKKERVRPSLPAASAAAASVSAAGGVVQPVSEEWSESRLVSLCDDLVRAGRRLADSKPLDHRTQFVFPSTLNSFERHLVHEIAERVGGKELSHEAQGEGLNRFITLRYVWPKTVLAANATAFSAASSVEPGAPAAGDDGETDAVDDGADGDLDAAKRASKRAAKKNNKKQTQLAAAQQQLQEQEEQRAASAAAKDDARRRALDRMELKSTGKLSKDAPARPAAAASPVAAAAAAASPAPISTPAAASTAFAALAEDDAACADAAEDDADDSAPSSSSAALSSFSASSASKSKNAANKKKKKAEAAAAAAAAAAGSGGAADDDDDFDSMLSEFGSDVCKFAGCSARVKVMGFLCEYCKEKHCVKHMNPVLHGCSAAHKQKQLGNMSAALKQEQKGGRAHIKDSDKAALHSKLEKKIAEDKKARTKQTKKEEGKK